MTAPPSLSAPVVDTTTSLVDPEELPWAELLPGIELKLLRTGGGSGVYTILTRFAPGIEVPTHKHFGCVHAVTLEGRWGYREYPWIAGPGAYVYEPPGSVHTLVVPADNDAPTVVLFTIESGQAYFDDDGNVLFIEDAESMTRHYADTLAAQGIPFPAAVLIA